MPIILGGALAPRTADLGMDVFLAEAEALPPLPQSCVDLVGLLAGETPAPASALVLLESDPRLVRATLWAVPPEMALTGLTDAWHQLGCDAVLAFALRGSLLEHLRAWEPPGDQELWRHGVATAGAARALARAAGVAAPLLAYAAGALYRTGEALVEHVARQGIRGRRRRLQTGAELPWVDREALGAALLERWGLPRVVVAAVGRRGDPMAPPLARLVSRATLCARAAGFGTENADLTPLDFIPPPLDEGARAAVAEVNVCEAVLARPA